MASVAKRRWKKPDGSTGEAYVVRYVDHTGARRGKTFAKKKDADRFCVQRQSEAIERGFGTYVEEATVDRVAGEFLRNEEQRMEDGRIGRGRWDVIEQAMRRSIRPRLGKMKMAELRSADVERWYNDLRQLDGLSARTAKDRVRDLKLMCDFAVRHGYATDNAAVKAAAAFRGTPPVRVRTFDRDQLGALLRTAAVRHHGQHERSQAMMQCVVHLAAFCGLRYGEIFGLAAEHVRLDRGVIEIRQSLTEYDELKGPKTAAGVRDVPLPDHLARLLTDWIVRWQFPDERQLVFRVGTRERPTMLRTCNFHTAHWRRLLDRAGLANPGDELHFHALRHFAASWWILNGLPLTDTASLMGHSKVDMTLTVYAHALTRGTARTSVFQGMSAALLSEAGGVTIDQPGSVQLAHAA